MSNYDRHTWLCCGDPRGHLASATSSQKLENKINKGHLIAALHNIYRGACLMDCLRGSDREWSSRGHEWDRPSASNDIFLLKLRYG